MTERVASVRAVGWIAVALHLGLAVATLVALRSIVGTLILLAGALIAAAATATRPGGDVTS